MKYRTVLFDLDGTLTDSSPGIINCVKHALTLLGREIPDGDTLMNFLGPPLKYSYMEYCGLGEEEAVRAVKLHRQRYENVLTSENALYDGVPQMLERLCGSGIVVALATSKPEVYAEKILEDFGICRYFKAVCGAASDGSDGKKSDVIKKALRLCGEDDLKSAVMVGDRFYDIEGAKTVGMASIGAVYGYGSRAELERAGADSLAESPFDVAEFLI